MTKILLCKATGLLFLGLGCYCLATGAFSALSLLLARTESGVVVSASISPRGEPTNCPCVVWGRGLVFFPQPGDWDSVPRVGDHVTVLAFCEGYSAGTLKSGPALWRVWKRAAGLTSVGVILLAGYRVEFVERLEQHFEFVPNVFPR
jgi:hypothetical protein